MNLLGLLHVARSNRAAPAALRFLRARIWRRAADEWYLDQPDCTAALLAVERFDGVIVDPCCGQGSVLEAARAASYTAIGRDIRQRRHGGHPGADEIADFFTDPRPIENLISNPPYKRLDEFIALACERVEKKAAILVQLRSLGSQDRSNALRSMPAPLAAVRVVTPRPSMPPGEALKAGLVDASGGSADYAWLIFDRAHVGEPIFGWADRGSRSDRQA